MKRKHRKRSGIHFLIFLVCLLLIISLAGFFYLKEKNYGVVFHRVDMTPSNEQLNNPYCGWYHSYVYSLTEDTPVDMEALEVEIEKDNSTRMCQLVFDISAYEEQGISSAAMEQIQGILQRWALTDKQLLVAFGYQTAPKQQEMLYLHMEQSIPLLKDYKNSIYGFFGGCLLTDQGLEPLLSGEEATEYISYQASMLDRGIFVLIPSAQQFEALTGFLTFPSKDIAFTEVLAARLGLYQKEIGKEISQAAIETVAQLSQYIPVGGTVQSVMPEGEEANGIEQLQQQHVSFLQLQDSQTVQQWKTTTYQGDEVFQGVKQYDYITSHMGYRYVLQDVTASFDPWKDEEATLTIHLENTGFANAYHRFDISVLLKNKKTEEMIAIPLEEDNRFFYPGQQVALEAKMNIKSYEKGSYTVYFLMRDMSTGEVIHLGNRMTLSNNGYAVGTLEIR